MRPYRSINHQTPKQNYRTQQANKSHIVEQSLQRKGQLISKYQTEINDLIQQIDSKQPYRKSNTKPNKLLSIDTGNKRKRAISSLRKQTHNMEIGGGVGSLAAYDTQAMKDYQKLILGLQFALQTQKTKSQHLSQKNHSLQSQISNLRNLLMGPDQQKYYQKTAFKQSQQKISYLQNRILDQKKQYEFIIDSKNQEIVSLQKQLKIMTKHVTEDKNNDKVLSKRLIALNSELEQLQQKITRKNIQIQRLKYQHIKQDDSDQQQTIRMRKNQRLKFYLEQMEISNKLILRKNTQILQLTNKTIHYQKILDTIQLYLDKKQVKNIDLLILQHPCVNKLRILLREKAVFERQLLGQLNQHNKKINVFETQIVDRDKMTGEKVNQLINDNKRLASTVNNLQSNQAHLQKQLQQAYKQTQFASNQIVINKKQFVNQVTKLKQQVHTISTVTKSQFDRMKIQNLKLSQQNRSLLFLVGQKQKQIHKKGQSLRTFEQYRQKINTLNVDDKDKRRIESVSEQPQQQQNIGTKLLLINNFSSWLFQWNKIKNWVNKKTLLNLILDKEEIRTSSLDQTAYVVTVLHDCFLQSKNIQIQERATILLAYYVQHNILANTSLYLNKLTPIIVRGLRPSIQGQQQQKHRLLNQSSLKILSQLQKTSYKWTHQMTNQMLSVNGLKYVFDTIKNNHHKLDQLIQQAFNVLIMIAKQNQMISFMMSFDVNSIIYNGLKADNTFIIFIVTLIKSLLDGEDYLKLQKSVMQYKKLFQLLHQDDDQVLIQLTLDSLLLLCSKSVSGFVKGIDKMRGLAILGKLLRKGQEETTYDILKKTGKLYVVLLAELQTESIGKYIKTQLDKLLEIVKQKRLNQPRFGRCLKILQKITPIFTQAPQYDNKTLPVVLQLYSTSEHIQPSLRLTVSKIAYAIYKRNPECLDKYSTQTLVSHLIQTYKLCNNINQQLQLLLSLILFQCEQKRTIQLLKTGRQSFINKLINDSLAADYRIALLTLKIMLVMSKQKFIQKFLNSSIMGNIINKVLNQRSQQEYLGTTLGILYFLSKIETIGVMAIDNGIVPKLFNVILQRHQKQPLIFKSLSVLQVLHTTQYKKKILTYILSKQGNLQILKVLNFSLRKAKNKVQLGTRSIFIYDYLNSKVAIQSLAILAERNQWLIEDLVILRNQFVQKVDSLVYKVELLLHEMSKISNKVKKLYERYRVEGAQSDDN